MVFAENHSVDRRGPESAPTDRICHFLEWSVDITCATKDATTAPSADCGRTFAMARGQKKPGRKAPAVSLDYPGSSSRASGWIWGRGFSPHPLQRLFEPPATAASWKSPSSRQSCRSGRRRCQPSLALATHPLKMTIPGPFQQPLSLATSLHQMEPSLVVSRGPPGRHFRNTLHKP